MRFVMFGMSAPKSFIFKKGARKRRRWKSNSMTLLPSSPCDLSPLDFFFSIPTVYRYTMALDINYIRALLLIPTLSFPSFFFVSFLFKS